MKKEKKPDYKLVANSLESILDVKNKLIKNQDEIIDSCMDSIDMYIDENLKFKEEVRKIKRDAILLVFVTLATLTLLILK